MTVDAIWIISFSFVTGRCRNFLLQTAPPEILSGCRAPGAGSARSAHLAAAPLCSQPCSWPGPVCLPWALFCLRSLGGPSERHGGSACSRCGLRARVYMTNTVGSGRKPCVISCWPPGRVCWRVSCNSREEVGVARCPGRAGSRFCAAPHTRRYPGQNPGRVPSSGSLCRAGQRWERPQRSPVPAAPPAQRLLLVPGARSWKPGGWECNCSTARAPAHLPPWAPTGPVRLAQVGMEQEPWWAECLCLGMVRRSLPRGLCVVFLICIKLGDQGRSVRGAWLSTVVRIALEGGGRPSPGAVWPLSRKCSHAGFGRTPPAAAQPRVLCAESLPSATGRHLCSHQTTPTTPCSSASAGYRACAAWNAPALEFMCIDRF